VLNFAMGKGFVGLTMIIFLLMSLMLVVVAIKHLYSSRKSVRDNADLESRLLAAELALTVPEERYAKGEI